MDEERKCAKVLRIFADLCKQIKNLVSLAEKGIVNLHRKAVFSLANSSKLKTPAPQTAKLP